MSFEDEVKAVVGSRLARGLRPDLEPPEYGYSWRFDGREYVGRGLGPPPARRFMDPKDHAACLRWAYEVMDLGPRKLVPTEDPPMPKPVECYGQRPDVVGRLAFAIDRELHARTEDA